MSFTNAPPRGSILYAVEVPVSDGETLGDTLFASGAAAYDDLSADMKEKIEGLYAVNSASHAAKKKIERARERGPTTPNCARASNDRRGSFRSLRIRWCAGIR